MKVYRTRPTDPDQIALVAPGVAFSRRILVTLYAHRVLLVALMAPGLIFTALVGVVVLFAGLPVEILIWAAVVSQALCVGPALFLMSVRSLLPGPDEVLLPRLLVLREGAIEVTPRDGPSFVARWTWIAEAWETPASFIFLLRREPWAEMRVKKSILREEQRALLACWLRAHGVLRAQVDDGALPPRG